MLERLKVSGGCGSPCVQEGAVASWQARRCEWDKHMKGQLGATPGTEREAHSIREPVLPEQATNAPIVKNESRPALTSFKEILLLTALPR